MTTHKMANATDLDETHWAIIDVMRDGRVTPKYLAGEVDESRQLVSKRLRDLQMAGVVVQIDRGLYELIPEEVPEE